MRLIDADWVLGRLKPYEQSDEEWSVTGGTALRLIHNAVDKAPTVDAVVVTRCKGCKYYNPDEYECGCDFAGGLPYVKPDDFCSYGEPKEG
uniref:Uncharacterized protein n=1 Tax=Siphoviridae sp. ct6h44 TaxID=2827784 RepID=A0A8S5SYN9_9CAUD|nr:MAG TPA: hypothetical protein [Siphoviridae sp. ct6h44]